MQQFDSLSDELVREFDIRSEQLSPELKLCVDRIDELRRREKASLARLPSPSVNYPIELEIASSDEQRDQIFQLRGEAFAKAGWIAPGIKVVFDEFDALPTAVLVMATAGDRLVGTIRVNIREDGAAEIGLPCEREFPAELDSVRAQSGALAEFGRVAIAPDLRNRSFRTTLYGSLIRSATMVAHAAAVDYALVAVHANISLFYQRMCGFKRLAKARGYGIIAEPTHLLGAEFENLLKRSSGRNAFFHIKDGDARATRAALASTHPTLAGLAAAHSSLARRVAGFPC
jgi:hypothetical protein